MNINLSKLLKNETIPQIHQPSLQEQLKEYGVLQYTKYNDGGVHFNLLDCKDDVDLEAVKNIIANHSFLDGYKQDKINKINEVISKTILSKYSLEVQTSANLGIYGTDFKTQVINDIKQFIADGQIKKDAVIVAKTIEEINFIK